MFPVPFIILGIAASANIIQAVRKNRRADVYANMRKKVEAWCIQWGMKINKGSKLDVNARFDNGNTLMIEALIQDREDIFDFLIKQHAEVNAMNHQGKTAIFYCKKIEQIMRLIENGADVNALDIRGRNVLFYCHKPNLAIYFVENGARVDVRDEDGKTILHFLSTELYEIDNSNELEYFYLMKCPSLREIVDFKGQKAKILQGTEDNDPIENYSIESSKSKVVNLGVDYGNFGRHLEGNDGYSSAILSDNYCNRSCQCGETKDIIDNEKSVEKLVNQSQVERENCFDVVGSDGEQGNQLDIDSMDSVDDLLLSGIRGYHYHHQKTKDSRVNAIMSDDYCELNFHSFNSEDSYGEDSFKTSLENLTHKPNKKSYDEEFYGRAVFNTSVENLSKPVEISSDDNVNCDNQSYNIVNNDREGDMKTSENYDNRNYYCEYLKYY